MKPHLRALAALSLCLVFGLARAQDDRPPDSDPPDRAGRLSYLQGDVSLQPAGEEDWATAIVNRPLTTGDKLWTDQNSRAEIYVGQAAVRLGSNTGFSFLNVDDDTIQMRMTAGVIDVNVHALDGNDQIEVDTPNLALSLLRPGRYRVEVNDAGDTTVVKISEGQAEASSGSQSTVVHAQTTATFRGNGELAAQLGTLGAPDDFDSWSLGRERRDERAARSQTAQYVAPEVTGYQDLDDNGSWSSEPEYGYVWTPTRVAVDWSPYHDGRWVWVAPWGWTWIDDAPWGYAPFHYGRWAHVRERWCWVPGPRHERAVYAPALVGWVGAPGLSVSISVGGGAGVGWFPLGPREVYVPARRFSPRYVERVNVTNTVIVNRTYITNVYNNHETNVVYRNRAIPGAVTAVSRTTFTSAERVGNHRVQIDERVVTREHGTAMAPQIAPERESRMGMGGATHVNVRMPPQTVVNRQVVVKRDPPPAAAHFVRGSGPNNAPRDQQDRSQRPAENNPQNRQADHGDRNVGDSNRAVEERNNRDGRMERNDRPVRAQPNSQPNTEPNSQPNADRQPRPDQPRAVAQPAQPSQPVSAERPRTDRPQRAQQERQQQNEGEQQRQQQRQQQQERQVDTQQADRRQQAERQQQSERQQQAERQQQSDRQQQGRQQAERQQAERPQEKPKAERPQAEKKQERENKRNQDDQKN